MRLFARETHIRTSFSNNVCNQNIRSDITNIYHLELIQLSQRPFVGQSVATEAAAEAAAEAAIAYDMLSTRVILAMFKQPFSRFVGPPSKCHSAPNGCTALTFSKFHSIFFGHAAPTLLVLFRQFCTLLSVFFSCSLLDCEIFRTLPVYFSSFVTYTCDLLTRKIIRFISSRSHSHTIHQGGGCLVLFSTLNRYHYQQDVISSS